MKYYLYKLIPQRPNFAQTMTPDEMKVMQAHVQYWTELLKQGKAIAFGPVADPRGGYGVGIVQLPDDADPLVLSSNDPAIKAGIGLRSEVHPMPMLVFRQ